MSRSQTTTATGPVIQVALFEEASGHSNHHHQQSQQRPQHLVGSAADTGATANPSQASSGTIASAGTGSATDGSDSAADQQFATNPSHASAGDATAGALTTGAAAAPATGGEASVPLHFDLLYGAVNEGQAIPGYQQQPVSCGRCGAMLGWRFVKQGLPAFPSSKQQQQKAAGGNNLLPAGAGASGGNRKPVASVKVGASDKLGGGGGSGGDVTTPPQPQAPPMQVVPYIEGEEGERLGSLAGKCLEYPAGWWVYALCHKSKVTQFHREQDGTRNPEWSLGDYDDSGQVERGRIPSARSGYYTSHFYRGGQRCDETKKGRQTEVQYLCCTSGPGGAQAATAPGAGATASGHGGSDAHKGE